MTGVFDNHDERADKAATACPPELDLAAYADGRLEGAALEQVETHLAECAACIAAVSDVRALETRRAETMTFASAEVIAAAAALVPAATAAVPNAPRGRDTRWRRSLHDARSLHDVRLARWLPWTAAAAASLLVSFVGYQAGLATSPARAASVGDGDLSAEASFGLFAADESGDLDLFAAALPEASS